MANDAVTQHFRFINERFLQRVDMLYCRLMQFEILKLYIVGLNAIRNLSLVSMHEEQLRPRNSHLLHWYLRLCTGSLYYPFLDDRFTLLMTFFYSIACQTFLYNLQDCDPLSTQCVLMPVRLTMVYCFRVKSRATMVCRPSSLIWRDTSGGDLILVDDHSFKIFRKIFPKNINFNSKKS